MGQLGFWLTFIGFNTTFLLMHLTGLLGMPRRVYTYEAGLGWDWLNLLSSIGGFIMAAGVALVLLDLLLHYRFGRKASRNPWHADTLEWAMDQPPAPYNFVSLPRIETRHPLWDDPELGERLRAGEGSLASIEHGHRVTWGTDAVTGETREICHLPTNSWWPLLAAGALALLCISLLVGWYLLALASAVLAALPLLRWSWENGGHPGAAPLTPEPQGEFSLESRTTDGPGRWGMIITLLADGTLYLSLLFGWFYLWTASPQWTAPDAGPLSIWGLVLSGILLTLASLRFRQQARRLARRDDAGLLSGLWQATGLGALHVLSLILVLWSAPLAIAESAHDAVLFFMVLFLLFHSGLAVIITALQAWRTRLGYVSARLPYEPQVVWPFWLYTTGIYWVSLALFVLLPLVWGDSL